MGRKGYIIGILVGVIALAAFLKWLIVPMTLHLEMSPSAYSSWIDRTVVRTGYSVRGRPPPCLVAGGGYWDGSVEDIADTIRLDQCLRLTEPRRWRGVWRIGLEWFEFCPAPARDCGRSNGGIWVDAAKTAYNGPRLDGLYEVEFVGRRTVYPGRFGHLGMYDHEMIVDQVISIRKVPEKLNE